MATAAAIIDFPYIYETDGDFFFFHLFFFVFFFFCPLYYIIFCSRLGRNRSASIYLFISVLFFFFKKKKKKEKKCMIHACTDGHVYNTYRQVRMANYRGQIDVVGAQFDLVFIVFCVPRFRRHYWTFFLFFFFHRLVPNTPPSITRHTFFFFLIFGHGGGEGDPIYLDLPRFRRRYFFNFLTIFVPNTPTPPPYPRGVKCGATWENSKLVV